MVALKYVVYPGPVKSRYDGQVHYIGASQLIALYGVDPRECMVIHPESSDAEKQRQSLQAERLSLIPLMPRYYGDYSLPSVTSQFKE